jgi:hypothetical protein
MERRAVKNLGHDRKRASQNFLFRNEVTFEDSFVWSSEQAWNGMELDIQILSMGPSAPNLIKIFTLARALRRFENSVCIFRCGTTTQRS